MQNMEQKKRQLEDSQDALTEELAKLQAHGRYMAGPSTNSIRVIHMSNIHVFFVVSEKRHEVSGGKEKEDIGRLDGDDDIKVRTGESENHQRLFHTAAVT